MLTLPLKQLKSEFGDQILVVFKNYPLDKSCNDNIKRKFHEYACEAALAARCAGNNGKFWPMHDMIYDNQISLGSENLRKYAERFGVDRATLKECLTSADLVAKIKDDITLGNKLGVESTPTLFFNGRKMSGGRSIELMRAEINNLLGR